MPAQFWVSDAKGSLPSVCLENRTQIFSIIGIN